MFSKKLDISAGVNVIGYFQGQFGLGETGRLIVSALEKQAIPFCLLSADSAVRAQTFLHYERELDQVPKYDINIFCVDAYALMAVVGKFGVDLMKDRYNINLFFWETNLVPKRRVHLLGYFDEVWVTTPYNLEALSPRLQVPVCRIPHPLQLNHTLGASSKESFGLEEKFTFLFCFDMNSSIHRKNPMAIITAFQKAFPGRSDLQLVIKSQNGHHHPESLRSIHKAIRSDSRMIWIDESMDPKRRFELMNACDCYVSLHRSEGLGLTMAEAMLLEKPVIATGYSGNMDFMTEENSYLCEYDLVPIGAGNHHYSHLGDWANVRIEDAAYWMNFVVENYGDAKEKGKKGKEDLMRDHSLSSVGACIAKRLQIISCDWNPKVPRKTQRNLYIRYLKDSLVQSCYLNFLHYGGAVKRNLKKFKRTIQEAVRSQRD